MQDFILKATAIAAATGLGYYACRLWEQSLRFQRHKLYVESTVRLLEAVMENKASSRIAKKKLRI